MEIVCYFRGVTISSTHESKRKKMCKANTSTYTMHDANATMLTQFYKVQISISFIHFIIFLDFSISLIFLLATWVWIWKNKQIFVDKWPNAHNFVKHQANILIVLHCVLSLAPFPVSTTCSKFFYFEKCSGTKLMQAVLFRLDRTQP